MCSVKLTEDLAREDKECRRTWSSFTVILMPAGHFTGSTKNYYNIVIIQEPLHSLSVSESVVFLGVHCTQVTLRYYGDKLLSCLFRLTIWDVRVRQLQFNVLSQPSWKQFTIWGAGKLGRRFFRSLQCENRKKVVHFCDIDDRKVQQKFYEPYPNPDGLRVPIVSYSDSFPPYVVCIKIVSRQFVMFHFNYRMLSVDVVFWVGVFLGW